MNIHLTRYGSTPMGTFGELSVGDLRLYTVERPWLNNQPFVSCVPAGEYVLENHRSTKYGNVWALVNPENNVYHHKSGVGGRYAILIHKANRSRELAGCIAPGDSLGVVNGEWAVMRSGDTMNLLRETLELNKQHHIYIRWAMSQGGIYDPV